MVVIISQKDKQGRMVLIVRFSFGVQCYSLKALVEDVIFVFLEATLILYEEASGPLLVSCDMFNIPYMSIFPFDK